jgi:hypothetical protein
MNLVKYLEALIGSSAPRSHKLVLLTCLSFGSPADAEERVWHVSNFRALERDREEFVTAELGLSLEGLAEAGWLTSFAYDEASDTMTLELSY